MKFNQMLDLSVVFKDLWSLLAAGTVVFFFPHEKKKVDEEKAKDTVSLDFRRAFENVSHKILRENKGIEAG